MFSSSYQIYKPFRLNLINILIVYLLVNISLNVKKNIKILDLRSLLFTKKNFLNIFDIFVYVIGLMTFFLNFIR